MALSFECGDCNAAKLERFAEDRRRKLQDSVRQKEAEKLAAQERAALQARKQELLAELNARGNPQLVPRRVPGPYYLSPIRRFLRLGGTWPITEVEGAWPVGIATWDRHGPSDARTYEHHESGVTPTGRIVPMSFMVAGDGVMNSWEGMRLTTEIQRYDVVGVRELIRVTDQDIVNVLERVYGLATGAVY